MKQTLIFLCLALSACGVPRAQRDLTARLVGNDVVIENGSSHADYTWVHLKVAFTGSSTELIIINSQIVGEGATRHSSYAKDVVVTGSIPRKGSVRATIDADSGMGLGRRWLFQPTDVKVVNGSDELIKLKE